MPRSLYRPGFTLVEMLIVIVIIGLLTGLLLAAVGAANVRAIDARMSVELNQLDAAMKSYKEKNGSYPPTKPADSGASVAPNATQWAALQAHLRRTFPRCTINTNYNTFRSDFITATTVSTSGGNLGAFGSGTSLDFSRMGPDEALVFWLGGLPAQHDTNGNVGGSSKLTGFNLDPANPFTPLRSPYNKTGRTQTLFPFEEDRLADVDNDGWYEYYPASGHVPYVYFDFRTYGTVTYTLSAPVSGNTAVPYRNHTTGAVGSAPWVNPDSFQIICAGQDDVYGTNTSNRGYPSFTNFDAQLQDHDNLTNFSTGRLENKQ